ncbi:MAG: hypothetical protein LC792_27540, partial [Actinobacteria bacterium]|nr:hypothetical protein [Actinomycetota bacterium]
LLGAAVPVGWALLPNRRHLGAAAGVAAGLGLVVALPWGLGNVWDQAFRYHVEAAGPRTPVGNLRKVISTLTDRDLPVLLAALAAVAAAFAAGNWRSITGIQRKTNAGWAGGRGGPVAGWLLATVVVLAAEHPLWRPHVSHLIPPAALLIAAAFDRVRRRLPTAAVVLAAVAACAVVPYQLVHLSEVLWPAPPGPALAAARADLHALPAGAEAISDDPGVVWRAGRRTPSDLVDTSILRIDSGRITAGSLARAAADRRVCAVLVWSHRFGDLGALPDLLRRGGYAAGPAYGGPKVLWKRADCAP